jgi:hypothetical protein
MELLVVDDFRLGLEPFAMLIKVFELPIPITSQP